MSSTKIHKFLSTHPEARKCLTKMRKILHERMTRILKVQGESRGHQLFEISYTCFEILLEIQEITEFKILLQETIQNQEPWERSQTKPGAV